MVEKTDNLHSTLCRSCGFCCTGVVTDTVVISPTEDVAFLEQYRGEIFATDGGDKHWIEAPCPAHQEVCTVYPIRPRDCRTYECGLLARVNAGETSEESAIGIVHDVQDLLDKLADSASQESSEPLSRQNVFNALKERINKASGDAYKAHFSAHPELLAVYYLIERHF